MPGAGPRKLQLSLIEPRAACCLHRRWVGSEPAIGAHAYTNRGDPLFLPAFRGRRIVVVGIRKSGSRPPPLYAAQHVKGC
jgi:hypothetical protein